MSRLDALIDQLVVQNGAALRVEAGSALVLERKNGDVVPLLNAKLKNEHVATLLRDAAPPDLRSQVEKGGLDFVYPSATATVRVAIAMTGDRLCARITLADEEPAAADEPKPPPRRHPTTKLLKAIVDPVPDDVDPLSMIDINVEEEPAPPPMPELPPRPAIETWFEVFLHTGASDLHLTSSLPAMIRGRDGDIRELVEIPVAGPADLEALLLEIMPTNAKEEWQRSRDTDFAYDLPNARLRVNVYCDLRGPAAAIRRIPGEVLTAAELGLPPAIIDMCRLKKGLVLVTGPTGCGKSTTLAAMIDWINDNRADHIVTIEDPIEFVHTPKRCLIHQRQVGIHTTSYARALRAALREDPDILLVGELRDLESIVIALEIAETGHLVLGTLHTPTAAGTIDRIVDQFDSEKQEQVRLALAEALRGVVSQTLCKRTDGGRALALEILINTPAVANLIREQKTFQIPTVMQTAKQIGMRTLNESLLELVKAGVVDPREALDHAIDKSNLKRDMAAHHIVMPTTDAG